MEEIEELREFHLRDVSGGAVCGANVGLRASELFATNEHEITCLTCLRVAYMRSLHVAVPDAQVLQLA